MSPTLLLIIFGGIGLLLLVGAGIALLSGGNRVNVDERLDQVSGNWEAEFIDPDAPPAEDEADVADRLDEAISQRDFSFVAGIRSRLSKADIKLRIVEYMGIVLALSAVGGLAGYILLGGVLGIAVGAPIGYIIPRMYTARAANGRIDKFNNQLGDTLNLWVNALRSGFSVLQGMEAIATEMPPPVSKEFERIIQEVRLGLDVDDALANSLNRVPSEDYDMVITAVNIQREVGGNLAEVLESISHTIRERVRIKGEVRTLTAQGRASGWIITLLPIGLTIALYFLNREYIMELFAFAEPYIVPDVLPCGWLALGLGAVMIISGGVAIQKIVDIEV